MRDFLQSGNHAQGGRFAAARRPHQHKKFLVFDVQTDVVNGANGITFGAFENPGEVFENNPRHALLIIPARSCAVDSGVAAARRIGKGFFEHIS